MIYTPAPGFSYSQIASWLKCRQKWYWQYDQLLTPRVVKRAMRVGSAGHLSITSIILGVDPTKAVNDALDYILSKGNFTEEEEEEQTEVARLGTMLGIRYSKALELDKWETVEHEGKPLVEQRLFADLGFGEGENAIHGTPDWVARERSSGLVFCWDFKFRKTLQPESAEQFDLQGPLYRWLLKQNGVHTDAFMKFQAKATMPKLPKVNKDGRISKAPCDTDWETFASFAKSLGQDPDDYPEMKTKLEQKEFCRKTPTFLDAAEVEHLITHTIKPACLDMLARDYAAAIYPSASYWTCNTCQYSDLCAEHILGRDTNYLRAEEFTTPSEESPPDPETLYQLLD